MPEKLTARSVEKLIAAGVPGDFRDAVTRGLVLRVKAQSHSWNYRRSSNGIDYRVDLGDLWSLEEARDLAIELDRRIRSGMQNLAVTGETGWDAHLERARRRKLGIPLDVPVPRVMPKRKTWTWEEAIERWGEALARDKRGVTHFDYLADLRVREMRAFAGCYVADITRKEVSKALTAMHARGVERTGEKVCGTAKRFFGWLGHDSQTDDSGVEDLRMAGLKPEKRRLEKSLDPRRRLRVPDGDMVGRLVLRFRDPTSNVPVVQRLASLLTLYTVQRRRAVCTADKIEFEAVPGKGGLWNMPSAHRKSANLKAQRRGTMAGDHVIPLPPSAWAIVEEAMALETDCPFLFNSARVRRLGAERRSMNPSTLTHLWHDVEGNEVRPHDMRRALATTYKSFAGLTDLQVKRILDHEEGVQAGDVTRAHYDLTTGEHENWPTMIGWVAWVDAQAERLSKS